VSPIIGLAIKLLKDAAVRYARGDEPDRGEWRGKYALRDTGRHVDGAAIFVCAIDADDPLRFFHYKSGLEFSTAARIFHTDLGSIPWFAQELKELQLKPGDFERSYVFHDAAYQTGRLLVRNLTHSPDWAEMTITRRDADVLLHDCLSADRTPDGKPCTRETCVAVWRAVEMFAGGPWDRYRQQEGA